MAGAQIAVREADEGDLKALRPALEEFCGEYGLDPGKVMAKPFAKLMPLSYRPYGGKYGC